jgi:hypothetical protein
MFERYFNREFSNEALIAYRHKLPDWISVAIREEQGKFFAQVELDGVIFTTQARRPQEIYDMVNDVVYTYYEIPRQYVPLVSRYTPPKELADKYGIKLPVEKIVFHAA